MVFVIISPVRSRGISVASERVIAASVRFLMSCRLLKPAEAILYAASVASLARPREYRVNSRILSASLRRISIADGPK